MCNLGTCNSCSFQAATNNQQLQNQYLQQAVQNQYNSNPYTTGTGAALPLGNQLGGYGYNYQYNSYQPDPKIKYLTVSLDTCKGLLEEFKKGEQTEAYLKAFFLIAVNLKSIDNLEYLEMLEQLESVEA